MEGSHEVLALGDIHSRLAAQGGVHLTDERRWHVDDRDATKVCGGGETGRVGEGAPTNCDERLAPVDVESGKCAADVFDDVHALGALAARQEDPLHRPALRRTGRRLRYRRRGP